MQLVFAADLHGDIERYRRLLQLASSTNTGAVVVGGDLLPHASTRAGAVAAQASFITRVLRPMLAQFRAAHPQIAIYLLPGNDDWAAAISELDALEHTGLIRPLHLRAYPLDTHTWIAGYACVPLTPFSIKDYERRDDGPLPPYSFEMAYTSRAGTVQRCTAAELAALPSIAEDLASLAAASDPGRTVYVCHSPPYATGLDRTATGHEVGSRAVRAFILRHQPPLTLHGHIHEAPGQLGRFAVALGATWVVNPGREPGDMQAVTLDTGDLPGSLSHTTLGPFR